jgi:hypothetical protein
MRNALDILRSVESQIIESKRGPADMKLKPDQLLALILQSLRGAKNKRRYGSA